MTMIGRPCAVVDASVVARWFLADEQDNSGALRLKTDFTEGKLTVLAPSLLAYELASVLSVAVKRARITEDDALKTLECILSMGIIMVNQDLVYSDALLLALQNAQSTYDNAYLSLATACGCTFYTADEHLIRALDASRELVRHVDSYGLT